MLEDMQLFELFVKEDVGKQVTFEDLQKWAKAKSNYIDKNFGKLKTSEMKISMLSVQRFIKENFLLEEENQNVITKPS